MYRGHGAPYIVDWDQATANNPSLLGFDYVNPSVHAVDEYASMMLEMVDNCPLSATH
jgi:hypothetical protein